jgi:hypothetical protein
MIYYRRRNRFIPPGGPGAWVLFAAFCASLAWGNTWTRIAAIFGWVIVGALYFWIKYIPEEKRRPVDELRLDNPKWQGPRTATRAMKDFIWIRDKATCQHCGKLCHRGASPGDVLDDDYGVIDHVIPYSWGGRTEIGNLQLLCHRCNMNKGAKYIG